MSPPRPTVKVIGRRLEAGDHGLRDFLTRGAQPFEWYDADSPAAQELLREKGALGVELPVLIDDGELIAGATVDRIAEDWGIKAPPAKATYDLIVVGAGPAGLAAAVYAASDGLSTVVTRARGSRRPGGGVLDDRELLRLPRGDRRRRAVAAQRAAGRALRRRA